jgi:signal peptidase I
MNAAERTPYRVAGRLDAEAPAAARRSVWLPVLIAFAGIGAGHAFAGAWRRGLSFYGAGLALQGAAIVFFPRLLQAVGARTAVFCLVALPLLILLASVIDAGRLDPARHRGLRIGPFAVFLAGQYLVGVGLLSYVRHSRLDTFRATSSAMYPSLIVGDRLLVDPSRFTHGEPARGELVLFESPRDGSASFVRRTVALPGDVLRVDEGHVFINDWPVPTCLVGHGFINDAFEARMLEGDVELEFLEGHAYLTFHDRNMAQQEPVWLQLGPGEYAVLRDNRDRNVDPRIWLGQAHGLPRGNLRGQGLFVWSGSEEGRFGASSGEPRLPRSLAAMAPMFERCMAERPPFEKTVPAKPKSRRDRMPAWP